MINKAVRIGWAMTGGQDRAATVRRIALAAAVRSDRVREVIASTATPPLKTGALHQRPPLLRSRTPGSVRPGSLIANPLVSIRAGVPPGDGPAAGNGAPVRLDAILRGHTTALTAGRPSAELVDLCRRHRLLLVKVSGAAGSAPGAATGAPAAGDWAEIRLDDSGEAACFQALTGDPGLTIIVRPDRVIAAVATRGRLPRLPWSVPAAPSPLASQMIPRPST
jgi:hypothetical protein